MHRILKIAHLLGLALFLGSVAGHVVAGVTAGAPGSSAFLAARAEISAATAALTLPGLGLLMLSGVGMAALSGNLRRQRWLWLHGALATAIVVFAVALVAPAGRTALIEASGGPALAHALLVEKVFGAANIALAIAALAIGVIKPRLRARAAGAR